MESVSYKLRYFQTAGLERLDWDSQPRMLLKYAMLWRHSLDRILSFLLSAIVLCTSFVTGMLRDNIELLLRSILALLADCGIWEYRVESCCNYLGGKFSDPWE